jgi:acetyl esterase/lipase
LTPRDVFGATEFVPARETERLLDIPYGPHGWRNTLDLHLPKGPGGLMPVVVYFHGGDGVKEELPQKWALPLLDRGYAIAASNRRPSSRDPRLPNPSNEAVAPFPAQIQDAKAAVRFLRASAEEYGLDPNRVAVMGHSEGGFLAALVAVAHDVPEFESDGWHQGTSCRVQAAVVLAAPLDLRIFDEQKRLHGQCLNLPAASFAEPGVGGLFRSIRNLDKAAWASPTTYVSSDDSPVLIISGFRDTTVPPHQADHFFGLLRQAGVEAQIALVAGASHGLDDGTVGPTIGDFLDRQLGKQ